ncbi:hypothetical protein QYS48_31245 [Marivirga arenosa]|uniref:Outer membrane protein beta-barrel domain-containing protein n=1 Tax=Marivirga arenosa TaxID=3059076 RepID=A0AA51N7L5_9BACT|nr:hypothetical protein [Marivirga sp. ABR2-2]WMN06000.1 hypothetical protein QYS48_31245 [Marivirga sp. ABR2-2]
MIYFTRAKIITISAIVFLFSVSNSFKAISQGENPIFPWNVELRAGPSFPTGSLANRVSTGFNVGARLGYSVRERLILRTDLTTELLPGILGFDDSQIWHYSAGVEYLFTDQGQTDWRISAHGGMGASTITFDDISELASTNLSFNYGLKLGRGITDNFDWFVSVMGRSVIFDSQNNSSLDSFTTFPITIGINHRFNLNDKPVTDKFEQPPN